MTENEAKLITLAQNEKLQQSDIDKIKELIKFGTNVNMSAHIVTPLQHAIVSSKNLELVKVLIENGADINVNNHFETPLHCAVRQNNLEIVKLLIEKGADVNAKSVWNKTPLNYAESEEIKNLLIQHGGIAAEENIIIEE